MDIDNPVPGPSWGAIRERIAGGATLCIAHEPFKRVPLLLLATVFPDATFLRCPTCLSA
jgi:hypothetical protein